ncbi:peptidoglycan-binding protein [Streptomyces sp. NPDC048018]|uniref:peptidoglycan-binding domain-containing protein n=1 Tax=Streptomyces sp. NPDC048018 TaxID=3365499 RepID=UPI0037125F39
MALAVPVRPAVPLPPAVPVVLAGPSARRPADPSTPPQLHSWDAPPAAPTRRPTAAVTPAVTPTAAHTATASRAPARPSAPPATHRPKPPPSHGPRPSGPPGVDALGPGSTGPEVEDLQRRLGRLHLYLGSVDGTFGPSVTQALSRFQASRAIPERAGVYGPLTRAALRAETDREDRRDRDGWNAGDRSGWSGWGD